MSQNQHQNRLQKRHIELLNSFYFVSLTQSRRCEVRTPSLLRRPVKRREPSPPVEASPVPLRGASLSFKLRPVTASSGKNNQETQVMQNIRTVALRATSSTARARTAASCLFLVASIRTDARLKAENPLSAVKSRPWLFVRIREAGDAR